MIRIHNILPPDDALPFLLLDWKFCTSPCLATSCCFLTFLALNKCCRGFLVVLLSLCLVMLQNNPISKLRTRW